MTPENLADTGQESASSVPTEIDPYARTVADIREPPTTLTGSLRHLGPGLVVTGSIVGTGELILTTRLGAEVGFVFLWFILLSCFIKVAVQIELGRYTISSGEATLGALDGLPGPRPFGVSWWAWGWFAMALCTFAQKAGIIAGLGQAAHLLVGRFPGVGSDGASITAWGTVVALTVLPILLSGRYGPVEKVTTLLVFVFTLGTVGNVFALQGTEFAIRAADLASGLSLQLPDGNLLIAIGVFGITGVGAAELIFYPYWCVEKGYARFCGPRDDSPEWAARARGWLRVLQIDAWLAFVIYSLTTVAFYLLGAAVLNRQGVLPEGNQMVETLSGMYRATFGQPGYLLFLFGALLVLYSTKFVSDAADGRLIADFGSRMLGVEFQTYAARRKLIGWVIAVMSLALIGIVYLIPDQPVVLVTIGAVAQAMTLPLIVSAALLLRYRKVDPRLTLPKWHDALVWLAALCMFGVSAYQFWNV